MYFDTAEAKLTDLETRTAALEAQVGTCEVDLAPVQAELTALRADLATLQSAVAALDARLDGVVRCLRKKKIGRVFCVALSGNDANPGTVAAPWRTLARGVSGLLPGDTLYVRSGTYLQTATLAISCSGTPVAPIRITTAPGEPSLAVVSGDTNQNSAAELSDIPGGNKYGPLVSITGDHVHFENFEVAYSGGRGVQVDGSSSVVQNCTVHHTWNIGIYLAGSYGTIRGNTVYRAGESNYVRGANGDWAAGIAWGYSKSTVSPGIAPYAQILNNIVYYNSGEGIIGMHADYGLVEGNLCYDNWAVTGIDVDQCSYTTLQKNLVYWTGDVFWTRREGGVAGILFSNEATDGGTYPVGHDNTVVNNIVVGCGSNIKFWDADDPDSALINCFIAHNTLVEAVSAGLNIDPGNTAHSNTRICNNLVLQSAGTVVYVGSTPGLTFDHNLWSRTPSAVASTSTDIVADPRLVDPHHARSLGQVLADWYQLTPSSPALGKGVSLSAVVDDYFGTVRGATPDIGAHEL